MCFALRTQPAAPTALTDGRRCDALGRAEAEGLTLHGLARVLHRGGESGQRAVGRSNRDLRVRIRAGELGDDRDRQFLQRHSGLVCVGALPTSAESAPVRRQ